MENKEELLELLENLIGKVNDLKDFHIRSKNFSSKVEAEVWKNVEKGILDNLHKANDHQRNVIFNSYKFRYYSELNDRKILLKEVRDNKLKQLLT